MENIESKSRQEKKSVTNTAGNLPAEGPAVIAARRKTSNLGLAVAFGIIISGGICAFPLSMTPYILYSQNNINKYCTDQYSSTCVLVTENRNSTIGYSVVATALGLTAFGITLALSDSYEKSKKRNNG